MSVNIYLDLIEGRFHGSNTGWLTFVEFSLVVEGISALFGLGGKSLVVLSVGRHVGVGVRSSALNLVICLSCIDTSKSLKGQ